MGKEIKKIKEKNEEKIDVFDKTQLISSKLFKNEKDILSVVVKDNEQISIDEAQKRIENFKKGKVI